jgi:hypothetical protein
MDVVGTIVPESVCIVTRKKKGEENDLSNLDLSDFVISLFRSTIQPQIQQRR